MAKTKPKAKIMVPDGNGGMVQVYDKRFEKRNWPIQIEIPKEQADTWLKYFSAECTKRGWRSAGISQLDAKENSGSLTVTTNENFELGVIWERRRNNSMIVKAGSVGIQEFPPDLANDFFSHINEYNIKGKTELFYRRGHLCYEGFPWHGEIWLDKNLRLGPSSVQDDTALIGPRIIVVDSQINGIDSFQASSAFGVMLRELSVFLTIITGFYIKVSASNGNRGWTWVGNANGEIECDVRNLGYWEKQWLKDMPTEGGVQTIPLRAIRRPELYSDRAYETQNELSLPDDIVKLWKAFLSLSADRKRQFLQGGNMWQVALSHYIEHRSLSFALMVVACESLKPSGEQFEKHNINHVIEALLGKSTADLLQKYPNEFRPQNVRAAVLHLGEFHASEFIGSAVMSSYSDPTFDQAYRELWKISQATIIEWLIKDGIIDFSIRKEKTSFRRWVKDNILLVLSFSLALGLIVGWFIRLFWAR